MRNLFEDMEDLVLADKLDVVLTAGRYLAQRRSRGGACFHLYQLDHLLYEVEYSQQGHQLCEQFVATVKQLTSINELARYVKRASLLFS